ncbi:arylesterase [Hufsiella ginkgonis]|uniref:Arylesterase n=1 Tax=Hufsiella ginkgonis TaxID=2695274 RepID=A0A7K1XY38_9SPHI|nr:arylesterase [Hufsiella ginkgonis]MXV15446.1 arylesterase [Hufsiella ginkgonis]
MKVFHLAPLILILIYSCNNKPVNNSEKMPDTTKATDAIGKTAKTILFFGNSLTAGYGLDDPSEALPAVIQEKIDSAGFSYKVVNAGLSGETTAGGKARIDWLLKQKIDVFVLELGANDGLRGIPVAETSANLQAITDKVRTKYPDARQLLLGMEVPPNMGNQYVTQFRAIFRTIADKNHMAFVPFMLNHVAGNPKLNQQDGIHPTKEGTRIVAANVWEVLEVMIKENHE